MTPTIWECFVSGSGYICESSDPSRFTMKKTPQCGSAIAYKVISVPTAGANMMFVVDAYMQRWANTITMEIVLGAAGVGSVGSGEVVHTIARGVTLSSKTYTIDVSKYAGKDVTFIISQSDAVAHGGTYYCSSNDHNFEFTLRDFELVFAGAPPPLPEPEMVDDTESFIIPLTTPFNCSDPTPNFASGCDLLRTFDANDDGIIDDSDWWRAEELMMHGEIIEAELDFVIAAHNAGSINALCPGCYVPTDPCDGVICPNKCTGYDYYSQKCVNGVCVNDVLIDHNSQTHCGYVPPPPPPPLGDMILVDAPASVEHGTSFDLNAVVMNTGGSTGTFRVDMYINGEYVQSSATFTLAPGATSSDRVDAYIAPSSGAGMSIDLKCIRIS